MKRAFALTLMSMSIMAGCGGEDEEAEEEEAGGACGAAPAMLETEPKLPTGFPTPDGVTYTAERKAGPSTIVEGYREGEIEEAFEAYKDAFQEADYEVTKDEREDFDAEVNFDGGGSDGQVKLVQACEDRTSVTITARPT